MPFFFQEVGNPNQATLSVLLSEEDALTFILKKPGGFRQLKRITRQGRRDLARILREKRISPLTDGTGIYYLDGDADVSIKSGDGSGYILRFFNATDGFEFDFSVAISHEERTILEHLLRNY